MELPFPSHNPAYVSVNVTGTFTDEQTGLRVYIFNFYKKIEIFLQLEIIFFISIKGNFFLKLNPVYKKFHLNIIQPAVATTAITISVLSVRIPGQSYQIPHRTSFITLHAFNGSGLKAESPNPVS